MVQITIYIYIYIKVFAWHVAMGNAIFQFVGICLNAFFKTRQIAVTSSVRSIYDPGT